MHTHYPAGHEVRHLKRVPIPIGDNKWGITDPSWIPMDEPTLPWHVAGVTEMSSAAKRWLRTIPATADNINAATNPPPDLVFDTNGSAREDLIGYGRVMYRHAAPTAMTKQTIRAREEKKGKLLKDKRSPGLS